MSRRLVSSGSSVIEVNTHLAINTIGGDFAMEVNMCPWTPRHLFFFFFGPRGKCRINAVCRGLRRMKQNGNGEKYYKRSRTAGQPGIATDIIKTRDERI